jgi:ABC-type multidrug transport system ATPase subunit
LTCTVTLTIPAGSVVGVVGRSGSGKTTFTRLIQGLYPPQQGVIRFDGVDIREIELPHLRRSIVRPHPDGVGVVPLVDAHDVPPSLGPRAAGPT